MNTYPIASLARPLQGTASNRVQIFPAGCFRAADGRPHDAPHWRMDASSAGRLISAFDARSVDLMIDYEHQTLWSDCNGKPNPAAGWITALEWAEGSGLHAVVTWTPAARAAIAADEYRYISPLFAYNTRGEILELLPVALTNNPALDMPQVELAAAAARLISTHPSYLSHPENQEESSPMDKTIAMDKTIKTLRAALGLAETAGDDATHAALAKVTAQIPKGQTLEGVIAAAATPDPAKYVPVATMAELQQQIAALSSELAEMKDGKLADRITTALADGRLLPAQKAWAEALGKSDPKALAGYLETARPIAALAAQQSGGKAPDGNGKAALSAEQAKAAHMLGMSADEYLNDVVNVKKTQGKKNHEQN